MTETHLLDVDGMKLQVAPKGFRGLLARHLGIIFDLFDQAEEAFVGGVVLKHIHDEAFLDGLQRRVYSWKGEAPDGSGSSNSALVLNFGVADEGKEG